MIAPVNPDRASGKDDICEITRVDQEKVARLKDAMLEEEQLLQVVETFRVLSDPSRVKIIHALSLEELCVCELAALLRMTSSAVSHQLRILRNLGLVKYRREGRMAYYYLCDKGVAGLVGQEIERLLKD